MENLAKVDKHINCIVEDYKTIKNEISRRSELQRFALLAYGGIVVLCLKFNQEQPYFYSFQILLVWLSSSIAYLFYASEDNIIRRLSKIATFDGWLVNCLSSVNYDKLVNKSLEVEFKLYQEQLTKKKENITLKDAVFPSESRFISRIIETEESKKLSELLNASFLFIYFIIFPLILTLYSVLQRDVEYIRTSYIDVWTAEIISVSIVLNISLHIYLQYLSINYFRFSLAICILLLLLINGIVLF